MKLSKSIGRLFLWDYSILKGLFAVDLIEKSDETTQFIGVGSCLIVMVNEVKGSQGMRFFCHAHAHLRIGFQRQQYAEEIGCAIQID